MTEPTPLRDTPATLGLVPLLTHLLDQAQRGEITAIASVGLTAKGGTIIAISDPENEAVKLIGAVATLQHCICAKHDRGWDEA